MTRFILFTLVIMVLNACSLFSSKSEPEMVRAPESPKTETQTIVATETPTKREPSSLWTDRSRWNDFYAAPSVGRRPGDIIVIRPTDGFKNKIASKGGRGLSSVDEGRSTGGENQQMIATIKEVLPNGVFRVEAKQGLAVGSREHEVELSGKIRESDIANDDSASTDQIFDVNLKVEALEVAKVDTKAKDQDKEKSEAAAKRQKLEEDKDLREVK